MKYYTLKVDAKRKESEPFNVFFKMDYNTDSYLGEISKQPYKHEIKIQDFIWEAGTKTKVNFITSLFKTYQNINDGFRVVPSYVLPRFNRALPSSTPRPMPKTHSSPKPRCSEGQCVTKKGSVPGSTTGVSKAPTNSPIKKEDDDDDDSSVTWIVVVTVIFSLLLFAAIAFFVYKWNQRYSGDFQVNRKPIGPAGTIVHYQDEAHKEKQRQMKL